MVDVAGRRDSDGVIRSLGIIMAALYLPLKLEFADTMWSGFLYAALVLGGVIVLFFHTVILGEFVVARSRHLRGILHRVVPFREWVNNTRERVGQNSSGVVVWLVTLVATIVAALGFSTIFSPRLPPWESILAWTALGGVAGGLVGILLAARLNRPDNARLENEGYAGESNRPGWLRRTESALYWLMLICVVLLVPILTRIYSLSLWLSFVAIAMTTGVLAAAWKWVARRWYEDEKRMDARRA
jgi:membrane protein implicated in regulation of membrane protease activity